MMRISNNYSNDLTMAAIIKTSPPLLRLPLELRQRIYAIIFGPRRLVDFRHRLDLDPWTRSMIYRPLSEKQSRGPPLKNYVVYDSDRDEDDDGDPKRRLSDGNSDSDKMSVHSLSDEVEYERRTGLLGVSKVISNEALDVLYGQHTFVINIHGENCRSFIQFGAANLSRVRHLRVVARPMDTSYAKPFVFDPKLWLPLLEGLLDICVVAQQPLVARGYYRGAPTLEEDLRDWTAWLEPILEYFSASVAGKTVVSLDAGGLAETTALMDKHFGPGYQKVETSNGDLCFKRGRYSLGSAYWGDDGENPHAFQFADGGMGDDLASDCEWGSMCVNF